VNAQRKHALKRRASTQKKDHRPLQAQASHDETSQAHDQSDRLGLPGLAWKSLQQMEHIQQQDGSTNAGTQAERSDLQGIDSRGSLMDTENSPAIDQGLGNSPKPTLDTAHVSNAAMRNANGQPDGTPQFIDMEAVTSPETPPTLTSLPARKNAMATTTVASLAAAAIENGREAKEHTARAEARYSQLLLWVLQNSDIVPPTEFSNPSGSADETHRENPT